MKSGGEERPKGRGTKLCQSRLERLYRAFSSSFPASWRSASPLSMKFLALRGASDICAVDSVMDKCRILALLGGVAWPKVAELHQEAKVTSSSPGRAASAPPLASSGCFSACRPLSAGLRQTASHTGFAAVSHVRLVGSLSANLAKEQFARTAILHFLPRAAGALVVSLRLHACDQGDFAVCPSFSLLLRRSAVGRARTALLSGSQG